MDFLNGMGHVQCSGMQTVRREVVTAFLTVGALGSNDPSLRCRRTSYAEGAT